MNATTDSLLAALRLETGIQTLEWASNPKPLSGGFWAELYDVNLADPTGQLSGRFVARIMPDPDTARYEAAVQSYVHRCGLAVPEVHSWGGPGAHLDRAWMLMDHVSGQPLLSGLSGTSALGRIPTLVRSLPQTLADAAAKLHRCPTNRLTEELADQGRGDVEDFLQNLSAQAASMDRHDLAEIGERLKTQSPKHRVICHGDLHPFNLLVEDGRWTLIDWSTAVLADPHYDLAFTTLMLGNPPLGGPAPVRAVVGRIGSLLANRFLRSYVDLSGSTIDPARLAWGRKVHALRALVELNSFDAAGTLDAHAGHPWVTLRPIMEAELATA